ncbi:MAG: hypothetical protein WC661_01340 [Opitutaceae bacterium]
MIKNAWSLAVGILLCLFALPLVNAGSISWGVAYGTIDPAWQTVIKGINYSTSTTFNLSPYETLNVSLTTTCYTGECGQLIHVLTTKVAIGFQTTRDILLTTSSVLCPALYAAPASPSSCTFNVSIASNSSKTFGFNLSVQAVPTGSIASKLTARVSNTLQLQNYLVPVTCTDGTSKTDLFAGVYCKPSNTSTCDSTCAPILNGYVLDFNGANALSEPNWIAIPPQPFNGTVGWFSPIAAGFEKTNLIVNPSIPDKLLGDYQVFNTSTVGINARITPATYNVTYYYGGLQSTITQPVTATIVSDGGNFTTALPSVPPDGSITQINQPDVKILGNFSVAFTKPNSGLGVISAIVLRCTVPAVPVPFVDNNCDGSVDYVEKLCSDLNVNQWLIQQLDDLGYTSTSTLFTAGLQTAVETYASDAARNLSNTATLPRQSTDIDPNALYKQTTQQVSSDGAIINIGTSTEDNKYTGGYYSIPHPAPSLLANAIQVTADYAPPALVSLLVQRPGLLFANVSGQFSQIYKSCNPKSSDICSGQKGCCWDGVFYNNGQQVFVNLTTQTVMYNASGSQPWNMQCIAHSPGQWTAAAALGTNTCTPTDYVYCAQDGPEYTARIPYSNATTGIRSYCFDNGSGIMFQNIPSAAGYQDIAAAVPEICAGGINSIDNNCNAYRFFVREAGTLNYGKLNVSETILDVSQDIDAFDASCAATVTINMSDEAGAPLSTVTVTQYLMSPAGIEQEYNHTMTDANGLAVFPAPATTFKFIATRSGYNPDSITVKLNYSGSPYYEMKLTQGNCNSDCTTTANPTLCSAACDGVNGCGFSPGLAPFLDGKPANINYYIESLNVNVLTCEGTPTSAASGISAQIACPTGKTLLVIERAVLKDGKPVKLVIPICK